MSAPFTSSLRNRLKTGKLDAETKRGPDLTDFVETNEPRLIAFNEYADDARPRSPSCRFTPMPSRWNSTWGSSPRTPHMLEQTLESTVSIQVFGTPSDAVLAMLSPASRLEACR